MLISYESDPISEKFSFSTWAEAGSSEDILQNEGFKLKLSTVLLTLLKILFVTILKLTEFFEALTKSNEYLIDKSNVINFDGELNEICGLKKKFNATLVNMGRSE